MQAYAVGDLTGGGADYPVRACGAGNVGFTGLSPLPLAISFSPPANFLVFPVVFCP